jgi:hypothetical protein
MRRFAFVTFATFCYVELARSVYRNNDRRAALRRGINELLGSVIVEVKFTRGRGRREMVISGQPDSEMRSGLEGLTQRAGAWRLSARIAPD